MGRGFQHVLFKDSNQCVGTCGRVSRSEGNPPCMIFYFVVIGDNAVWDFGLSPDLPKSRLGSDPTSANNAMYTSSPPAPTFGVQTSNPGTLLWLEEHRGP